MHKKILQPYTIIPDELYVLRDADRQLSRVVAEMGRPGYVLVARQMGKTNLLLHLKRRSENRDDVFVYVDLSKPFENDRDCFRAIIDQAIESSLEKFKQVQKDIVDNRNNNSPAYKEHEFELRRLLSPLNGRLVIILDEIDSLTNTDFSDKVFAHIRSTYFSRTNFPEYGRLTYILSGVIEPNEIIKDKRISPFNIGQKIYLDDFSLQEFSNFLDRAKLKFSDDISRYIYDWTGGNPRITWDVCAELEELVLAGNIVVHDTIDKTIGKLYLNDFRRAPVDHIRELVTENDDLRNAVSLLRDGRASELSDLLKSKLYLAGVTGSTSEGRPPRIKNRIIDEALSPEWLRQISVQRKGVLSTALEKSKESKYSEALSLYEEFLKGNSFNKDTEAFDYYQVGTAAYHVGEYEKAIKYFKRSTFDEKDTARLYWDKILSEGICYYQLGNYPASIELFTKVINCGRNDSIYLRGLLNLAAATVKQNSAAVDESLALFKKSIDLLGRGEVAIAAAEVQKLLAFAYFNIGNLHISRKSTEEARVAYIESAAIAAKPDKPIILHSLYSTLTDRGEKLKLLTEIIQNLIASKHIPTNSTPDKPFVFDLSDFYHLLIESFSSAKQSLFEPFLVYCLQSIPEFKASRSDNIFRLGNHAISLGNGNAARELLLEYLSSREDLLPDQNLLNAYRWLAILLKSPESDKYAAKIIAAFRSSSPPNSIAFLDVRIFADTINRLIKEKEYEEALQLLNMVQGRRSIVDKTAIGNYALFFYYQMLAYDNLRIVDELEKTSREALKFIDDLSLTANDQLLFNVKDLEPIKEYAKEILQTLQFRSYGNLVESKPYRRPLKPGRNEIVKVRYKDGSIKQNKYKKVLSDIERGLCELVDE